MVRLAVTGRSQSGRPPSLGFAYRRAALLAMFFAVAGSGCETHCGRRGETIATLVHALGEVSTARAGDAQFGPISPPHRFQEGDALKTGIKAEATVQFPNQGALIVHPSTIVRFFRGSPNPAGEQATGVRIEEGEAVLESAGRGLFFQTEIGSARIEAGGRARLTSRGAIIEMEILVGTARFEGGPKGDTVLVAGERVRLDVGRAIIEPLPASDAGATDAWAQDASSTPDADAETNPDTGVIDAPMFQLILERGSATLAPDETSKGAPLAKGESAASQGAVLALNKSASLAVTRDGETVRLAGAAKAKLGGEKDAILEVRQGSVSGTAIGQDLIVQIPGGFVTAKAKGSRMEVQVKNGRASVTASAGRIDLWTAAGREPIQAGEIASVARNGEISFSVRNPTRSDLTIPAGESASIHDPLGPSAVAVSFEGTCPSEGVLELTPKEGSFKHARAIAQGPGRAIVLVKPGMHKYRVRCVDEQGEPGSPVASGTLRATRDSGRIRLPRMGATNTVEADGRRYTILYQNLMPRIIFAWRKAPSASSYLHTIVSTNGKFERVKTAKKALLSFGSGTLPEGEYRWWFETDDNPPRRSQQTMLKLDFDNAAPAVYLSAPPVRFSSAESISVEGAAVDGATVSIDGTPVELDAHHRFKAGVTPKLQENAIAIRIQHPRSGTHYYLRKWTPPLAGN